MLNVSFQALSSSADQGKLSSMKTIVSKFVRLVGISLVLMSLSGCLTLDGTPIFGGAIKRVNPATPPRTLLMKGNQAMMRKDYKSALMYFQAIDTGYPLSKFVRGAQLGVIKAYYRKEDYPQALAAADRYLHLYPRGYGADYAYYAKGMASHTYKRRWLVNVLHIDKAQRHLADMKMAYQAFAQVVRYFPRSRYAPLAKAEMRELRNLLAKHDYETAGFYYDRRAFVGAANRAADVVKKYADTDFAKPALRLMIKSYEALGEDRMANDARRQLHKHFG